MIYHFMAATALRVYTRTSARLTYSAGGQGTALRHDQRAANVLRNCVRQIGSTRDEGNKETRRWRARHLPASGQAV